MDFDTSRQESDRALLNDTAEMIDLPPGGGVGGEMAFVVIGQWRPHEQEGLPRFPLIPICVIPLSDSLWTQTVVWHHPCLLHNQNVFSYSF